MRRKLKSQSGASILIALVFFLLCVTVGIVVLTAAASNTGQLTHVKDQRQAYLATASAARLIREEMEQVEFVRTDTAVACTCGARTSPSQATYQYPGGPLAETLREFCQASQWQENRGIPPAEKTITLEAEGLPHVTAAFSAAKDLTITVSLHTVGENVPDHPLTLTLNATPQQPNPTQTRSEHETKDGDGGTYLCDITTTVTTTTITWTGEIGKGAAA